MGTAIKYPVPHRVKPSFVRFDMGPMSKLTNDGLTRPGIGCFIAVYHVAPVTPVTGKGNIAADVLF